MVRVALREYMARENKNEFDASAALVQVYLRQEKTERKEKEATYLACLEGDVILKKTMLIVLLSVIVISGVLVICNLLLTKRVALNSVDSCYYRYQYFDQNGNVCNDVVPLQDQDCKTIVDMLSGFRYRKAFDVERGFTEAYSLEFRQQNGDDITILLQYGQHGLVRLNNTTFDRELDSDMATQLYTILNGYHRFDRVLVAG